MAFRLALPKRTTASMPPNTPRRWPRANVFTTLVVYLLPFALGGGKGQAGYLLLRLELVPLQEASGDDQAQYLVGAFADNHEHTRP